MGYTYNMPEMLFSDIPLYMHNGAYALYEFDAKIGPELVRVSYDEGSDVATGALPVMRMRREVYGQRAAVPARSVQFWSPLAGWYNTDGDAIYVQRAVRRSGARTLSPQDLRYSYGRSADSPEYSFALLPDTLLLQVWEPRYPQTEQEFVEAAESLARRQHPNGVAISRLVAATLSGDFMSGDGELRVGTTYAGAWRIVARKVVLSPADAFRKVVFRAFDKLTKRQE